MPPAAGLRDEYSQAFYEYWWAQRVVAPAPPRAAIDPAAMIPDLLPQIHLMDRQPDGGFRWRLMGTGLAGLYGRDLTGGVFDLNGPPYHDPRYLDAYGAVTAHPCVAVIRASASTISGRHAGLEQTICPLLDGEGHPSKVIAYTAILGLSPRELMDFGSLTTLAVAHVDFIDLGAGIPPSEAPYDQ